MRKVARDRAGIGAWTALAMATAAMAFAGSASAGALHLRAAVAAPVASRPAPHWSAAQVRELIALVEDSRRHGLEPASFGLAALRSELAQATDLYRTPGSPQLDALAGAAAIALMRAYRHADARADAGLADALRTNRLRDWIGAAALAGAA